jgi:hypothetical protein
MFSDIASRYVAEGEDFDGQGTSDFTNLNSVSTDETISKIIRGKSVYPHPGIASLADAIDYGIDNGNRAVLLNGSASPVVVDRAGNTRIEGVNRGSSGIIGSGGTVPVVMKKDKCTIEKMTLNAGDNTTDCVQLTSSTANRPFECRVYDCYFAQADRGVWVDGREAIISHNHFQTSNINSDEVVLTSNADKCVVSDNTQISAVTNNGSNNIVVDNSSP